jgi:hypothetical protein
MRRYRLALIAAGLAGAADIFIIAAALLVARTCAGVN